jgi:hypothetical protein
MKYQLLFLNHIIVAHILSFFSRSEGSESIIFVVSGYAFKGHIVNELIKVLVPHQQKYFFKKPSCFDLVADLFFIAHN